MTKLTKGALSTKSEKDEVDDKPKRGVEKAIRGEMEHYVYRAVLAQATMEHLNNLLRLRNLGFKLGSYDIMEFYDESLREARTFSLKLNNIPATIREQFSKGELEELKKFTLLIDAEARAVARRRQLLADFVLYS